MSTLDDLVRLSGTDENPEVLKKTVRYLLEFSFSANERQRTVVCMGSDRQSKKIRLLGKDVNQGVVVVRLLGKEVHPIVRLQTTKCLANLAADSPENQVKIASYSGVLDALTNQLEDSASASMLQEHTARCFANLAQTRENHMRMASSSVLGPLVKLLASDHVSQQVHLQAARCLTNLAMSDENGERIGNYPGALDALGALLDKQGSSGVHKYTTRCLTSLASSQKIQLKIVSDYPVLLNGLVRLLGENGTSDVQQQSLKCLTTLADHYQRNQVDIAAHSGVLDALLRLLRHNWITTDRIKVQAEAARCLLKLSSAPENLSTIASHAGAFDALVRCLEPSRRTREVQNLAVECFRCLAAVSDNQLKIVSFPGTVSALLNQLVQVENSDGQELAAWCFSKLATAMETKVVLTSYPGLLKSLVAVLNRSNPALLEPAMKCLMKLAQSDELKVRVKITAHRGMIDALVRLLGSHMDVEVIGHTVTCMSCLALAPINAKKIISHPANVLKALVNLLQLDTSYDVLECTVKCFTNLACSEESQVKMASFPGVLDVLVLSLSVRNELARRVQEQVVKCLAQLSAPPANQMKIATCSGLHDALRRLAVDNVHPRAQKQAELCLANLRLSPVAETDARRNSSELPTGQHTWRGIHRDSLSDPDDWYVDPITWDTMCDPVKCNDGVTYDRWTIINNGIRKSPYDRSLTKFYIVCDDIDVRKRLFRISSHQEAKFRGLRDRYREKALQSARALEFEDAMEKLNNVCMWAPSDRECKDELDRILNLLSFQSDSSLEPQPQNSLLEFSESPEHGYGLPIQIDGPESSPTTPVPVPSSIPVISHEDVIRLREREGGRMALISVIFVFGLYFAVFLFV